jgi:hypothetical protein
MGFLDFLRGLSTPSSLASSSIKEISMTNKCVEAVERKREKALKRAEKRRRFEKLGKAISDWSEDDRYADDDFYKEKLAECYERNRPIKRAIGLP